MAKIAEKEKESKKGAFYLPAEEAKQFLPIFQNSICLEYLKEFIEDAEVIGQTIDELIVGHDWENLGGDSISEKLAHIQTVTRLLEEIRVAQALYSFTPKSESHV